MASRVRAWLVEAHGTGTPGLRQAAKAMSVSERTLNRRLAEEGTSFREVLDDFRRRTSVRLLASRRHSIAEVAFLLG